jgi:hypothetical protein
MTDNLYMLIISVIAAAILPAKIFVKYRQTPPTWKQSAVFSLYANILWWIAYAFLALSKEYSVMGAAHFITIVLFALYILVIWFFIAAVFYGFGALFAKKQYFAKPDYKRVDKTLIISRILQSVKRYFYEAPRKMAGMLKYALISFACVFTLTAILSITKLWIGNILALFVIAATILFSAKIFVKYRQTPPTINESAIFSLYVNLLLSLTRVFMNIDWQMLDIYNISTAMLAKLLLAEWVVIAAVFYGFGAFFIKWQKFAEADYKFGGKTLAISRILQSADSAYANAKRYFYEEPRKSAGMFKYAFIWLLFSFVLGLILADLGYTTGHYNIGILLLAIFLPNILPAKIFIKDHKAPPTLKESAIFAVHAYILGIILIILYTAFICFVDNKKFPISINDIFNANISIDKLIGLLLFLLFTWATLAAAFYITGKLLRLYSRMRKQKQSDRE